MGQKREFVSDNLELISRLSHDFGYGASSYTDEEKRLVVSYYLSNKCSAKAICERFNICKKTLYNWISIFADEKDALRKRRCRILNQPNHLPMPKKSEESSETPEQELVRLREENKKLQEALKIAEWSNHAKDVMIDLAEKTFNISIRKKSGAKQ